MKQICYLQFYNQMDQNQRQNQSIQQQSASTPARATCRITRGFSDLPKQQPKVVSEEESQEEEISQGTPKVKKIHHMTLKKLERMQKLAEMERLGLIPPKPVVQKLPPRKRGRPKGVTKKVIVQSQPSSFVEQVQQSIVKGEKKELRKRQNNRKMIDEQSAQPIEEEKNDLKPILIEIQIPQVVQKQIPKQAPKPEQVIVPVVAPPAPKKRGRKKKVQPEVPQNQPVLPPGTANAKVFTVPKAQTYDNYNKYYNKLLQQTKESKQKQVPLIFDKFSDSEGYKALLSYVKNDNK